jgi:hypothetical protein
MVRRIQLDCLGVMFDCGFEILFSKRFISESEERQEQVARISVFRLVIVSDAPVHSTQ